MSINKIDFTDPELIAQINAIPSCSPKTLKRNALELLKLGNSKPQICKALNITLKELEQLISEGENPMPGI